MSEYDVIVVGLGAMGSAALYELSRRGQRVLGLEAFERGHQLGSSHGESRVIRLAYFEHPNYVPLLRRAYQLWAELERQSGDSVLQITGGLMIGLPDSELLAGARASAEQHGLDYELLDAAELRRRYPAFEPTDDEMALAEPHAGFLRPERCIAAHLRLAHEAGADTRFAEPVRSWQATSAGVQLSTDTGQYSADQVVFTPGARISQILGEDIAPVRAERAILFWMEPLVPEQFEIGRLPIYLWETSGDGVFYGFPHVEWPGVKVSKHHSGDFCDPDLVDRTVNAEDERRLRAAIARRIPGLNGRVVSGLVCLYENSPDGHFIIDRMPDHANVIFGGGFSGHGFKFASVVGEILADMVTTGHATPHADFLKLR